MSETTTKQWLKTACMLCHTNCGLAVQLDDSGRHFARIKGDKEHPASRGYTCNKALQIDYYQNGRDRLREPLRRRPDGAFEEIDWPTAIREVARKFLAARDNFGGETIMYYGGGGQGNHLPGLYAAGLRQALGVKYRSNALAQEKTGMAWVNQRMFGAHWHGDFDSCEVAVFVGKNPWQSNGIQRARAALRQIARDDKRSMVVIDPKRTETAELADYHLQVKPGRDAWCLSALLAVMVREDLVDHEFLATHADGAAEALALFADIDIDDHAAIAGVDGDLIRRAARRIASAESMSLYEDLGVEMAPHSTKSNDATALAVNPADAAQIGLVDGGAAKLSTKRGKLEVMVRFDDRMRPGHVSLPNGMGLSYPDAAGVNRVTGSPPNELTSSEDRDAFAGTPWHKHVPARLRPMTV